jgi:hypothetical protein
MKHLSDQVPKLIDSQDPKTGRFGTGIWIVTDQHPMYPLAAIWSHKHPDNRHFHDPAVLKSIVAAGDALIADMDDDGKWEFRKKDGSTWGKIYMPWTYSRWLRAYSLTKTAISSQKRAEWDRRLVRAFDGIAKHELDHIHNIPAYHAASLYLAGKMFGREDWRTSASVFMRKLVATQDAAGFWSENHGPVMGYNFVYVDALGIYYHESQDEAVVPALKRAAQFHGNFVYPDGTNAETVDERQVYNNKPSLPSAGFTATAEGRGYAKQLWDLLRERDTNISPDALGAYLHFGAEGPIATMPRLNESRHFTMPDGKAVAHGDGNWFVCLSAYHCPVPQNRWIQDRQNLLSLFHKDTGLIAGGGNTKLQPKWSTFTLGDESLLRHKAGDEDPDFRPPEGILHVPTEATLDSKQLALALKYSDNACSVSVRTISPSELEVSYSADRDTTGPMTAHLPLMPRLGKAWKSASGKSGKISENALRLDRSDCGEWFSHAGWSVTIPDGCLVEWPVLPHNQYAKDGAAKPESGRIVVTMPFGTSGGTKSLVVKVDAAIE